MSDPEFETLNRFVTRLETGDLHDHHQRLAADLSSAGLDAGEFHISDWDLPIGQQGTELAIALANPDLDVRALHVAVPDCASWAVPSVGLEKGAYAHPGYRGPIGGLLEAVVEDIDRVRGHYPASTQGSFDRVVSAIEQLLRPTPGGQASSEAAAAAAADDESPAGDCTLVIRDPSGTTVAGHTYDDGALVGVTLRAVDRSWAELVELELEPPRVDDPASTPEAIAELVQNAKSIAVLTGAGVSVESGIPPFRTGAADDEDDETGAEAPEAGCDITAVWKTFDPSKMTVANFNDPASDEAAAAWWHMKRTLIHKIADAEPNPAHRFFADLGRQGRLAGIITQNIDSLHHRSGVDSARIVELHGHMRSVICSRTHGPLNPTPMPGAECDFRRDFAPGQVGQLAQYVDELMADEDVRVPACPKCGARLRMETVMFGQPMPDQVVSRAQDVLKDADLLFVIGTSLLVKPACDLPGEALARSVPVVMVNLHPTQYDAFATGLVHEPAGAFLNQVAGAAWGGDVGVAADVD